MNPFAELGPWLAKITALKGPELIIALSITLGWLLKIVRWIPNKSIPGIVIPMGIPLTLLLVRWPAPGDMDMGVRWPDVAAWLQLAAQGIMLGALAWVLHHTIVNRIEAALKPKRAPGHQDPGSPTP